MKAPVCGILSQYMPPENLQHGEISPKTDVWGCGVVALELLTGRPSRPNGDGKRDLCKISLMCILQLGLVIGLIFAVGFFGVGVKPAWVAQARWGDVIDEVNNTNGNNNNNNNGNIIMGMKELDAKISRSITSEADASGCRTSAAEEDAENADADADFDEDDFFFVRKMRSRLSQPKASKSRRFALMRGPLNAVWIPRVIKIELFVINMQALEPSGAQRCPNSTLREPARAQRCPKSSFWGVISSCYNYSMQIPRKSP